MVENISGAYDRFLGHHGSWGITALVRKGSKLRSLNQMGSIAVSRRVRGWISVTVLGVALAGCADERALAVDAEPTSPAPTAAATVPDINETTSSASQEIPSNEENLDGCAHVVDVEIAHVGDGDYSIAVTVKSADTGENKYADLWEVRDATGTVLGTRVLAHPHVEEQPFTRSLGPLGLPADIDAVVVAARDSVAGFCGETMVVEVPR